MSQEVVYVFEPRRSETRVAIESPDKAGVRTITSIAARISRLPFSREFWGPTNGACFGAEITSAACHTPPTWYIVAGNDRMILPELERQFAKAMNPKTLELPSSHVPMLSHPGRRGQLHRRGLEFRRHQVDVWRGPFPMAPFTGAGTLQASPPPAA